MTVFLAEDNFALSKALITFFKLKSYDIEHYDDGEKAFDNITNANIKDVYVIDINLPSINGLELVKQIRNIDKNVPIIIITASVNIHDFENAYDFGCSDYIKKPFNLKELDIRLNKLLQNNFNDKTNIILKKNIRFDATSTTLYIDNKMVELRKKEIRFLTLLFENRNNKISTNEFEMYIWEGEIKDNYPLRQLVNGLRRKLKYDFIKTEIGIGYSIHEDYR
jgi:DNA-binding response OmpR family regulator